MWKNLNGVALDDNNNLTKNVNTSWGNAGASSENVLSEATDGWVEMLIDENNKARMLGLSEIDKDAGYKSTQFGIFANMNKKIRVFENDKFIGTFGTYLKNDRLKIERVESRIQYIKNDSILYVSAVPSINTLVVDVSLYTKGTTMKNVKTSF